MQLLFSTLPVNLHVPNGDRSAISHAILASTPLAVFVGIEGVTYCLSKATVEVEVCKVNEGGKGGRSKIAYV